MAFAATKARIGFGTTFGYSTVIPAVGYTQIAEIIGITPAKPKIAKVETNRFDSNTLGTTGLPIEDNLPGWVDPGEWKVKFHYDHTQSGTIFGLFGVPIAFQVTKPDGKGWTAVGYISDFGDEIPLKDKMTVEVTITINGGSIQALIA